MAQDFIGQPIVDIVVEQEGQPVMDPVVLNLLQTRVGQPLSIADVRNTSDHLLNLRRFDDVQTSAEAASGGVRVRYVLVPSHPIDRIEFRGNVAVSESDLRRVVTDRFGRSPNPARAAEAAVTLQAEYRRLGYPAARVAARVEQTHDPHRATLWFDVDAGRRALVSEVYFRGTDEDNTAFAPPEIRKGVPYDPEKIRKALDRWEEQMHSQGFYGARATFAPTIPDEATVQVTLTRGPRVMVEFTGDPLPEKERERLAPIRAEGATDEDLLEDAKLAVEQYLRARGYRDASAESSRDDKTPGLLKITFHVTRGRHYTVDSVRITGNMAIPTAELEKIITVAPGQEYVAATLDAQRAAVEAEYRTRGFTRAGVMPEAAVLPTDAPDSSERRVEVIVSIDEGPRTIVRAINFKGNKVFTESQLGGDSIPVRVGAPYLAKEVIDGRDLIRIRYQNQGYLHAVVRDETTFVENGTQADVTYTVTEGAQAIVEHIIIIGNDKTKRETILNELEIREGEPLGQSAQANSRTKLARLGLFRRYAIEPIEHPGETAVDVLVTVEEADRTTFGVGGGVEGTLRARPTGPNGTAEDHLDLAPRGEFEIGRRNLWGSNRSVNLFARVSLRSTDVLQNDAANGGETQSNPGFNEFRVIGTFREPRLFNTRSELLVTGAIEQAIRTSFNFARRIARAEVGRPLTPTTSFTARYSFEKTKLFDEIFAEDEKPLLIDKLFPQVRLSKLAGSFVFDTRDDLLDPSTGRYFILDTDLALRALGSEVGFVRTFAQGFLYRQLPARRRTVVALGARVGLAHGFAQVTDQVEVSELPASERFFAGGDTTVRGFSLDRLVNQETITNTGFPVGGNSVVILNAELRSKLFRAVQGVGFLDGGNVFPLASDLRFTDVRPAAGFGIRINTDFGPIRFDLGFNLDPQQFQDDQGNLLPRERRTVFHVSIGQAF